MSTITTNPSKVSRPTTAPATVRAEPKKPAHPSTDDVRFRAYLAWESAGRPEGLGLAFWLQAEGELSEGPSVNDPQRRMPRRDMDREC